MVAYHLPISYLSLYLLHLTVAFSVLSVEFSLVELIPIPSVPSISIFKILRSQKYENRSKSVKARVLQK